MVLVDFGNSSIDVKDNGALSKLPISEIERVLEYKKAYYICVNSQIYGSIPSGWIDIKQYIDFDRYYSTMGIDRVIACEAIEDGVIIDAGSAITVDIKRDGLFCGGFISLGYKKSKEALADLSDALDVDFNLEMPLDEAAFNTPDALTFGFFAPLVSYIKSLELPIYLTGGDSDKFKKFLPDATIVDDLIFRGMEKIIKESIRC